MSLFYHFINIVSLNFFSKTKQCPFKKMEYDHFDFSFILFNHPN